MNQVCVESILGQVKYVIENGGYFKIDQMQTVFSLKIAAHSVRVVNRSHDTKGIYFARKYFL